MCATYTRGHDLLWLVCHVYRIRSELLALNRGTTLLESLNSLGCWNFSFVGVLEVCVSGANPEEVAEWPHPQNEEEVCL